jgi:hypothetical protein
MDTNLEVCEKIECPKMPPSVILLCHFIGYPLDSPQLSWEKMKNNGKNHGFSHCVMP